MKKAKLILVILMMQIICMSQIINVPGNQPTIQAGINAATAGDTVLVEDGEYFENIRFMGKAITLASRFIIDGDEDHIDNTIIDGSSATNPDSASCVMFINFEDTTSIICGFTIQGGSGLLNQTWNAKYGGGIACWESGPQIKHNKIKDNILTETTSRCGGGGIGSWSETGSWWIIIDNNDISNNLCVTNAESAFGGGIYTTTNAIIRNNTIENNNCYNAGQQADGGGIEVERPMDASITAHIHDNIIQNNTVEGNFGIGAGISLFGVGGSISNNIISNNEALAEEEAHGSAMYIDNPSSEVQIIGNDISNNNCIGNLAYATFRIVNPMDKILIRNNTISGNMCTGDYGAMGSIFTCYMPTDKVQILNNDIRNNSSIGETWSFSAVWIWDAEDAEVIADGNLFINNSANNAGAFYARNSYNVTVSNNLFSGNNVNHSGGALYFHQYYETDSEGIYSSTPTHSISKTINKLEKSRPLIINNTFTDNHAGELGGAIYTSSLCDSLTLVIINNIFRNNAADSLGNDIRHGGDEDIYGGYNNLDTDNIWGNWTGEFNIDVDPLFIDELGHIDESSECIEAGVISIEINGDTYHCPDFDIDGQMRPLNGTADIGADEVLITRITKPLSKTKNPVTLEIYPNPVSNNSILEFRISHSGPASIQLFDNMGKHLKTIISQNFSSGTYQINLNSIELNEGVYFCELTTDYGSQSVKIIKL